MSEDSDLPDKLLRPHDPPFELPAEMLEMAKQFSSLQSEQGRPSLIKPHPSVKTNNLLSEQLEFLKASSTETSLIASKALSLAKWANIIATIAAIMATIAAIPVIIDLYSKIHIT